MKFASYIGFVSKHKQKRLEDYLRKQNLKRLFTMV